MWSRRNIDCLNVRYSQEPSVIDPREKKQRWPKRPREPLQASSAPLRSRKFILSTIKVSVPSFCHDNTFKLEQNFDHSKAS